MKNDLEPIREIDLMAYADGLLDDDPARKAAVEAYMADNPASAEAVAEIRAQNREIAALYGREIERPMAGRLVGVLRGSRSLPFRRLRRMAAAVPFVAAAAGAGWWAGNHGGTTPGVPAQFLMSAVANHQDLAATVAPAGAMRASDALWTGDRLWLEIKAPDLSAAGYDLVGREKIGPEGSGTVRLVYRASDNSTVNLFVRPRWDRDDADVTISESDGLTVHYWPSGPLSFALTTEARDGAGEQLATMIQRSVGDAQLLEEPPLTALDSATPLTLPFGNAIDDMPAPESPAPTTASPLPSHVN